MLVQYQKYYPAPEQGSDTVPFRVNAGSRSRGKHLAMSLYKLKASVTCLNIIVSTALTTDHAAKHRMAIYAISHVAEVGTM